MAMQAPLWLYFPQQNQALQVIQLPTDNGSESKMVLAVLGFSNVNLPIVGILAIPQGSGDTDFHTVYERQLGDSDFLRAVVTGFCRPDASGHPSRVWLLNALDHTIQFHQAPFLHGFPPPAASVAAIDVAPVSHALQLFAPAITDEELASLMPSIMPSLVDIEYNYSCYTDNSLMQFEMTHSEDFDPIVTFPSVVSPSIVFHQDLIWRGEDTPMEITHRRAINHALNGSLWKRVLFVTKRIYVGSYLVGLQNPFEFLEKLPGALASDKCLLSNCFVMAVEMSHMTLQELHEHPLMVETQTSVQATGWDVLRLTFSKYIDSRNTEICKVIQGCILSDTGFSDTNKDDQDAKAAYFFQLLSSDDRNEVRQGILEIVQLHMFSELVWVSVFQNSSGLTKGNCQGRMADIFPEQIQGQDGLLGSGLVANLLTVVYHALHLWLPDRTPGRKLSAMHQIIMAALGNLYANEYQFPQFHEMMRKLPFIMISNVLPIDPKLLEPKMSVNDNRLRNTGDILPIVMYATDSTHPGLPNAVFTSLHSQQAMQEVDSSCF
ncbi:uncharacterized protein F5891DRAFT_1193433 [Suillus fuscotomentosus]|uniref:Uncharacterized protein n=1 Tax=Suillus fuscotomentosus TaxID=1912939 RepID=A0AAD4DY30_9AGAM|nr:uncharacterized protein F5891DRAFT_1193433 [Suillus fuscotomentosus]KAG1896200.1 hypothetical protein F5891DRAFT_1193433 [Suillus fuscotomentosus]